jgi:hypothetical protein
MPDTNLVQHGCGFAQPSRRGCVENIVVRMQVTRICKVLQAMSGALNGGAPVCDGLTQIKGRMSRKSMV